MVVFSRTSCRVPVDTINNAVCDDNTNSKEIKKELILHGKTPSIYTEKFY